MSRKAELQDQAKSLGVEVEGLTIPQLEEAIKLKNNAQKVGVEPIKKEVVKKPDLSEALKPASNPPQPAPLVISLADVNSFLNVINIIMVDDIRGASISTHFTKMIQQSNPQIQPAPRS